MTAAPPLPPAPAWRATIASTYDGDTVRIPSADMGGGVARIPRKGADHLLVRLAGIAARELSMPGGPDARDALAALLPAGTTVTLWDPLLDEYGNRIDAWIVLDSGLNVCDAMVQQQWAAPWNGKGKQPTPPWPRTTALRATVDDHAARAWDGG